jgi:hypothetical protein
MLEVVFLIGYVPKRHELLDGWPLPESNDKLVLATLLPSLT